jgi:hypothetical protein
MPFYDLHVLCSECESFHDALVRVSRGEVFEVRRVSDLYDGKIPLEFYPSTTNMRCPVTGKPVKQERADMMVLASTRDRHRPVRE